jgi:hypothetical protein
MMKFFKLLIFPVLLLMVISGCVKDKYEPVVTNNQCDTTYYAREIKPIIVANCAISGCHDGHQATPNFNSFIELKAVIEEDDNGESELLHRLDLPLNDPKHMPVDARLQHDERDKIEQWIDDGYVGC